MKKISTRRGDIWIANLRWGEGNVLRGQHPVIIVSSDQTNRGSGIVTVVSKARVCFRVGTLMHSEKMAELEQAIRHQLEVA